MAGKTNQHRLNRQTYVHIRIYIVLYIGSG